MHDMKHTSIRVAFLGATLALAPTALPRSVCRPDDASAVQRTTRLTHRAPLPPTTP